MESLPTPERSETFSSTGYKARIIATHVVQALEAHRMGPRAQEPLMVALQGPQGCGKTTVCNAVKSLLESPSYSLLNVAVLSLDDLYLQHAGLAQVAALNPSNRLLVGRGQPGTHDVPLGVSVLSAIRDINQSRVPVELPVFDKSLFAGQGDRSAVTVPVNPPLDVFIFEGWSVGFTSLQDTELEERYSSVTNAMYSKDHSLEDLRTLNTSFHSVAEAFYPHFTVFVQLMPSTLDHIFRWRLQQEQHMKSLNGGRGMEDDEVRRFVQRYMPGYELWGHTIRQQGAWAGHGLGLVLGAEREVTQLDPF